MSELERELAVHPALAMWIIGVLATLVTAMAGLLAKLLWPRMTNQGSISREHCGQCRADIIDRFNESVQDIHARLEKGDQEFKLNRRVIIAVLLILKPLCDELAKTKTMDCDELHRLVAEVADI